MIRVYRVVLQEWGASGSETKHVMHVRAGTRFVASDRALRHAPARFRRPCVQVIEYLTPGERDGERVQE
jgi:hypothetical protein